MKQFLVILGLITILTSCSTNNNIEGEWVRQSETENKFFPRELTFNNDTLYSTDDMMFNQIATYKTENDSISLTFQDQNVSRFPFSVESDSILFFNKQRFIKLSSDAEFKPQAFNLLGWNSGKLFEPKAKVPVIGLVKIDGNLKVMLNNRIAELNQLPTFLETTGRQPPFIYVYLGEGVYFKDLVELYCWLNSISIIKVELITHNDSFKEFYSITDYFDIGLSLQYQFRTKHNILPVQSSLEYVANESLSWEKVLITNDINIQEVSSFVDTVNYSVVISDELGIRQYLNLVKLINAKRKNNIFPSIEQKGSLPKVE